MIQILELKILLEKASKKKTKPKKYHQDYLDLDTWKSVIKYLLKTMRIEDNIQDDNTFSDVYAEKIFNYLDLLPTLEGISQEQLIELNNYLTEVFDLLLTNTDAKKIVFDLKAIFKLLNEFEKEIPPIDQQVGVENPDLPSEDEEPTIQSDTGDEEGSDEEDEELPPEEDI